MCSLASRSIVRAIAFVALCSGLLRLAVAASADDFRTWTDTTGKFKITAKFVSLEGETVTLEKQDGTSMEIELSKLSAADQKAAKESAAQKAEDPFKPKSKDPFKTKSSGAMKSQGSAGAGDEVRMIKVDWSDAKIVQLAAEKSDWSIPVKPSADLSAGFSARPITLPSKVNIFERVKGLVLNAASKHAVVGYNMDEPKPRGMTRLVLCDLATGKPLGAGYTSSLMAPIALHDDGFRVLMRRDEFGFGKSDRLEIWKLGTKGIDKVIGWFPYDDLKDGDRDVKWAAFLDAKRLATMSDSGKLAVWEFETAKPIYALETQHKNCLPALSPDRKYIAFNTDKEVGILGVDAGEVLALQPTLPNLAFPSLAFSPSGQKLACLGAMTKLFVWDLATGKSEREISLLNLVATGTVLWPHEDYVFLGGHNLVDLVNEIPFWDYQGAEMPAGLGSASYFVCHPMIDRPGALVPVKMPQPGAEAALKRAVADPNFFILKQGATVAIDVNPLSDPSFRDKVRASLTAKLQANGVNVAPSAPLTLVASTTIAKPQDITYRTIGGPGFPRHQTYKVTDYNCNAIFMFEGKQVWASSSSALSHLVALKPGQTMEQYLREHEKHDYTFFDHVELPKLLTRPSGNGQRMLGTTHITATGAR